MITRFINSKNIEIRIVKYSERIKTEKKDLNNVMEYHRDWLLGGETYQWKYWIAPNNLDLVLFRW